MEGEGVVSYLAPVAAAVAALIVGGLGGYRLGYDEGRRRGISEGWWRRAGVQATQQAELTEETIRRLRDVP